MTTGCTNWINVVKDSGADPKGVKDATTILNTALNSCPAGGVVYVPGGATLKISGTITIPSDVTLKGDDASDPTHGSVLSVANGSNLAAVISDSTWASNRTSVSNAPRVEGIVIHGNGANQASGTGVGVAFCSYRGEVLRCRINDTRGDGIRITNMSANGKAVTGSCVECKIMDNTLAGCGTGNLSSNREGIALRDSGASAVTDFWIERNVVWEGALTETHGMGVYCNSSAGGVVSENHLYGIGTHGIYLTGGNSTRIINNYIEYFGQRASFGVCYGIYAVDSGSGPGMHISGNTVNIDQAVTGNTFVSLYLINGGSGNAAFYSLGPNNLFTAVAAATAVSIQNQGAAASFVVAGCPQMTYGFTAPYALLNAYGTYIGSMFGGAQGPAYASAMAVDLTKGTTVGITLHGNLVMDIPVQMTAGMQFTFIFYQDAAGSRTVTWTNNNTGIAKWVNATFVPAATANAMSAVAFVTDGYDIVQVA
jgi:hypothetical protein